MPLYRELADSTTILIMIFSGQVKTNFRYYYNYRIQFKLPQMEQSNNNTVEALVNAMDGQF